MADYIDREVAVSKMRMAQSSHHTLGERMSVNEAVAIVEEMPTADVAPVVHGRWDDIPNAYMSVVSKTGAYHGNATTCSVCLEVNPNAFKTNYCPNCGAKMEADHG